MAASRFYDAALTPRLAGTLLLQWSCERNYFVPCDTDVTLCGGKCDRSAPFLALIGERDSFFSATYEDSVALRVARANRYEITGNCYARFVRQRMHHAVSVVLPQYHDGLYSLHGLSERFPNLVQSFEFAHLPEEA